MAGSSHEKVTMYLRGMPVSVVREAKATAARRGVTLAALVTDALTQALGSQPQLQQPPTDELQADADWYEAHKAEFLSRYPGEYLAIADRQVIDHDADFSRLAERVFPVRDSRPVFMPKCVDGERVVSLRSPRLRQR